jgi:tetratricopeptide (TPR) repeat protein
MSWWKRLVRKAGELFGWGGSQVGCSHGDIHLRQDTPEFEWFIAKAELENGSNLAHGMSHLAQLLSYDPGRKEWVELLDAYLEKAGSDPERLLPRGKNLYFATEAVRAYIYNRDGKTDKAVSLLIDVTQAKFDARYLEDWVLNWLQPLGKVEQLSDQTGLALFALCINRLPEARRATVRRLRESQRFAELADRYFQRPQQMTGAGMLHVGVLRRAARFNEGMKIAEKAFRAAPNWHDAVGIGLLLRQKGEPEQAESWFRKALEFDPQDVSARLEAGDTFFEVDNWEKAIAWYDEVLAVEPKHTWAYPSALYCRWRRTGEGRFREELLDLVEQQPDNERAQAMAYRAFMPPLPYPEDATANVLRQVAESLDGREPDGSGMNNVTLTLSSLEAPSNLTAYRLEMRRLGQTLDLEVTVENVPQPDPRQPFAPVKYLLWNYRETDPVPALPEPPADVVDEVARLARMRFDDELNWADASRTADQLGTDRVAELLAVMVYPPDAPAETPALDWLPRVQHVVCQIVAQLDTGWEHSVRRDALYSLLLGPTDWTTTAAIRVLARIGMEEPAHAYDIHQAFQKLADNIPRSGFCCWLRSLYVAWLQLPHLFPMEREKFQNILRELDQKNEQRET